MFAKNRHINLKFSMLNFQEHVYNILCYFLKIWKILDFGKSYIKISVFNFLGMIFLGKPRQQFERANNFTSCAVLCLHFTFNLYFWDFSNIYPFSTKKWHDLESLKSAFFKTFLRKNFKILQKDAKLMYREICQVSRRYL